MKKSLLIPISVLITLTLTAAASYGLKKAAEQPITVNAPTNIVWSKIEVTDRTGIQKVQMIADLGWNAGVLYETAKLLGQPTNECSQAWLSNVVQLLIEKE